MFFVGAIAGGGLDVLSSLHAQLSTGSNAGAASPFAVAGSGGPPSVTASDPATLPPPSGGAQTQLSPDVLGFLISHQSQQTGGGAGSAGATPFQAALFGKLDTDGNGTISKSEFEAAFAGSGDTSRADALFNKIDTNGDGAIDPSELVAAEQSGRGRGHHHHHHVAETDQSQSGSPNGLAAVPQAAGQGASSQIATNAAGSGVR